ncbi:hypothetical protein [Streptomyces capoamus]|uniref:hypothetical protein n=1 Tax=Streptomyces capoamus TaxID=68183 RepID=UPI003394CB18
MIRTIYKGRQIKVLAVRGRPNHRKLVINGYTIQHGWQGDDTQALDWFRLVIDRIDELVPGTEPTIRAGYMDAHWYEPGTIDVNPKGHATAPGSVCLCILCVIDDPAGSKARYAPLAPDACRDCHQLRDGHQYNASLFNPHHYIDPTPAQKAARQAHLDRFAQLDEDDEPTCDARYHKDHPNYLARPQCLLLADHRDAAPGYENRHVAAGGFMWPREVAQ